MTMNNYVTDTMALILKLENRKLPNHIKDIFIQAEENKLNIFIPSIVLAEISYLSEKSRIEVTLKQIKEYVKLYKSFKIIPLELDIIEKSFEIRDIKELHDRLIAGTSIFLNNELITNDPIIQNSKFVKSIW